MNIKSFLFVFAIMFSCFMAVSTVFAAKDKSGDPVLHRRLTEQIRILESKIGELKADYGKINAAQRMTEEERDELRQDIKDLIKEIDEIFSGEKGDRMNNRQRVQLDEHIRRIHEFLNGNEMRKLGTPIPEEKEASKKKKKKKADAEKSEEPEENADAEKAEAPKDPAAK